MKISSPLSLEMIKLKNNNIESPIKNNLPSINKAKEVAKDFSDTFVSFLYNLINEKIEINPLLGGGTGEKIFRSLLIDENIKNSSNFENFGIQKDILEEILKYQEIKE